MPKTLTNLDLNKNEIQNVVLHKSSTAPSNPKVGQIYYNTTDNNLYRYNGTSWVTYQNALDTEVVSEISIDSTPTQSSTNLVTSGGVYAAIQSGGSGLPDQTGHSGEFLTTDGTDASWETLPDEVFIATYNSTSYTDVLNAYNANKLIFCKYYNTRYFLTIYESSSNEFTFSTTQLSSNSVIVLSLTDGWSNNEQQTNVPNTRTINSKALSSNITLTASDVGALPSSTSIPSPADATPLMDGTAAVGTSTDYAREDHVHPTDTGRASSTHTHGNITNSGDITTSSTIASGDRLVINDESSSKITNSSITFGTSETQFLTNKGTWATPPYPVTSVNTKTGAVSLTASDVSAISTSNLVTSVSSQSTDSQVPSAKLLYDMVGDVESVLETLLSGSA